MTFKLPILSRWECDEHFLDPFEDEIVRLTLFMLANRNWTGNRFEADLIGTPLFFRRVRNKKANGWDKKNVGGSLGGMEIGRRDGAWKILIASFDPNRVSADRAQRFLNIGWKNMTMQDDYDLYTYTDVYGRPTGLGSIPGATEMQGDRDVFTQDMMIMRLYSTDQ